jgi:hypothetical protein
MRQAASMEIPVRQAPLSPAAMRGRTPRHHWDNSLGRLQAFGQFATYSERDGEQRRLPPLRLIP